MDQQLRNDQLQSALEEAEAEFIARTPESRNWQERASGGLPGGNTRTVLHFTPYPLRFTSAHNQWVTDADGQRYRDYLGEYSAGLYGHTCAPIMDAARGAIADGTVLGGPNTHEVELAELMCARFPSLDLVRFTNSGTEANMMALAAARAHTGRDKVMVFAGGYHGGVLYIADYAERSNAPFDFVIGTYNDLEATRAAANGVEHEIAAILIEPMMGGGGAIVADTPFLSSLKAFAEQHGIVLIFDEVMTSRNGPAGHQGSTGVTPHMSTFGKYLGGGFSFGAFGGRQDIMRKFDPFEPDALPHAGTFNNNVTSMAAGIAGLKDIYTPERAIEHTERGDRLRHRLNDVISGHGLPAQVTGSGTIMCFHFHDQPVRTPEQTKLTRPEAHALFHLEMLKRGIYFARRGYMSLSLELTEEDDAALLAAFDQVLREFGDLLCS
ncbi:MAG: aminotransferase class III-fold pyridoxal phosphate-dependent enzyme [Pseudomonadota bacterium]